MATNRTTIEYSMMRRAALREKKVETKARRKLYHDRYAPLKLRRAKLSERCIQMTLRA